MIKYAILFFNTIALLIYQLFFSDGITITQKAPPTAKIGTQFTVEITINKGDVDGFAKLQQELPDGFTAEEGITNGASFTFSNNAVKFIWMALPVDKEFKVSYKVKVDNSIVLGDKYIGGKFSYIVNNAKQQVDIPSVMINVSAESAPVAAKEPEVNNKQPETAAASEENMVSISGFYLDDKDVPIQGLKVNLMNAGVILQTTTTDNSGFFSFTKLAKDNSENDVVMLDEKDTHFVGKKSKVQYKDNKQVVIQEKELTGNVPVAEATKQPEVTQPATPGIDNSNLTCSRHTPPTVTGNSFDVELDLVKGNISGFAKCVEVLPPGCTVTAIETAGSSFTFADNKVKFVWVSLPPATVMKVTYKVTLPEGTATPVVLDGVFSYIENDETRKCTFNTNTVNVTPTATQPAVANTAEPAKTTEPAKATEPVVAYQPEPVKAPEPVVANTTEPAKTEEPVKTPEPVVANTTEPAKTTEPLVAYQPEPTKQPETVNVTEPVKAPEPVVNTTEPTKTEEPVKAPEPVSNTTEPAKTMETVNVTEPVKVPEPVVANVPEPVKAPEPVKSTTQASAASNPALAASNVPAANTAVSYAVQIAALRNAKEPIVLASYFKITEKVNTEMADGMTKYTVGSHKVYKEAHDARDVIKNKGVSDAWVTSYNAGKRITVQEALMISAQKWYK